MIIDANNMIMGRMASFIAKKALLGEKIDVINCEKAFFSGNPEDTLHTYWYRGRDMGGPRKGPFLSRMPDRFVRRIIRGMLPMNKARGREAFKRVMCYIGTPEEFKDKPVEKLPHANTSRLTTLKKVSVAEICKHMGGKWNEL